MLSLSTSLPLPPLLLPFLPQPAKLKGERGHSWSIGLVSYAIPLSHFILPSSPPLVYLYLPFSPLLPLPPSTLSSQTRPLCLALHLLFAFAQLSSCCTSYLAISLVLLLYILQRLLYASIDLEDLVLSLEYMAIYDLILHCCQNRYLWWSTRQGGEITGSP